MSLCLSPFALCSPMEVISLTPLSLYPSFPGNIVNTSLVFLSLSSSKTNSLSQEAIFVKMSLGFISERKGSNISMCFAVLECVCVCVISE